MTSRILLLAAGLIGCSSKPASPRGDSADLGPSGAAVSTMPSVMTDSALTAMTSRLEAEFGAARVPVRTVGILLYDGYTTLDAMGPMQVLSELPGVTIKVIAKEKGLVQNMMGFAVRADYALGDVDSLDVLVVPGGFAGTYRAAHDTTLINWIKRVDQTTTYTTSVCTGAWLLGAAGVLRGKPATTHWWGREILERDYGATYLPERYVRSGKYWTSAGVTAGMDMSLALINEIRGERYTKAAMLDLEYDPKPPFVGGTERNTDSALVAYVRTMYDRGMQPVIDEIGRARKEAQ